MDNTLQLLKELTEAHGVPGYEAPVRAVVRKYMSSLGDISQDKIGSVICRKPGSVEAPRVMLAGHMDEIGFMVKHITKEGFLTDLDLVLIAPLFIGVQLIGLIGLGPEFTGGRYGHDDFDLLTAIGSQAASALMAVRMAEKLAEVRERQAWDKLSAFVLHDIKNAANMLSLARGNASNHLQNPQFQQDFLLIENPHYDRFAKKRRCG